MKPLMTIVFVCLGISVGAGRSGAAENSKPGFARLAEALAFIQTALEKNDYAALRGACATGEKACLAQQRAPFDQLQAAHQAKPLTERFGKLDFPDQADTFKLGGHGSEIGHLHVDFIRTQGKWQLRDIYNCR